MKKICGIILSTIGTIVFVLGFILTIKGQTAVSAIGGADGPTATFIAGKFGNGFAATGIVLGIILLAAGIFIVLKKK